LRGKFHHQHGIGKAAQDIRTINAPRNKQERQARSQPQQKAEDIGAPALGQRSDVALLPRRLILRRCVSQSGYPLVHCEGL
jgi:hypothetical protein